MANKYNRGSEWRKWDLHFHTPSSYDYKDHSVTNQQIVDTLIANEISVVAITDHHVIDVARIKDLQRLAGDNITILPGIECCSELGGSESIHFIGIFAEDSDIDSIRTKIQGKHNLTPSDISSKGEDKIICRFEETCKTIIELGGIVTVHAGTKTNSIESIKNNLLVKQEQKTELLSKYVGALEIGKIGDEKSYKEIVFPGIGFEMPIIICSDNHKLSEYSLKHNLWIKADPTFNGLRQILFEPEDRVKIQLSKPEQKVERLIISSLQFDSDDSLFGNQEIFLNPNLNSIIGGKSSGKSLLLHSTASAIDKGQVERISSALKIDEYKSSFDYDLIVKWGDGVKNSMNTKPNEDEKRRITYIPQLYINYLAEKDNKEELNQLILNILLQNEGMRNEYNQKTTQIEETSTLINTKLSEMQNTWDNGIYLRDTLREIGEEKAIQKSINDLKKQIDDITKLSTLSPDEQKKYSELRNNRECLIKQRQSINILHELSSKVYREIYDAVTALTGSIDKKGGIVQVGKLDNLYQLYNNIPQELESIKEKIKHSLIELTKTAHCDIAALNLDTKLQDIETRISKNDKLLEPFIAKLKNLVDVKKIQDKYNAEMVKLENSKAIKVKLDATVKAYRIIQEEIGDLLQRRYSYYLDVKKFVNEKYNSIGEGITLELDVYYNLNNFAFYQQINKAKIDNAHLFNSLFSTEKVVYDKVPALFKNIKKKDNTENSIELKYSTIKYPLNQGVELFEVYRGLTIDNFELNFEVKYLNDSLLKMSPGKKGTVLLILFLQISSSEYPILIDQPEDNLDNRTIYDLLCQIIRAKKKDRQIIIVSHNANLVVATDSENIIVANQEGQSENADNTTHRFEYINGAIESSFVDNGNSGILYKKNIKGHVCDILEGGDEAFKHREKKYF